MGQVASASPLASASASPAAPAPPGAASLKQAPAAAAVAASPELPSGVFFPAGGLSRPKSEPSKQSLTPSEDAMVGRVLDQRYRIEEAIGIGGMGVVYKARHVIIDKPLAIKLLRHEHASQPEVIKRFLLEAQLASRVKHPNIVDISDYGQIPGGTAYYAMEYLTGETLAHRIDTAGKLDPPAALDVAVQILQGLQAAHASKIIHRDLKSENIFLCRTPDGGPPQIKILDFGIARIRDKWTRLTANGALIGTPAYMSPEQAQGQEADERADLYAFGVILFEMLAGRVPFKLPTVAMILSAQIYDTPPTMKEVDAGAPDLPNVEKFIRMLLAKNRDERPQTAADAIGLLRAAAELDAAGAPPGKQRRPTVTIGSWAVAEGAKGDDPAVAATAPITAPPTTAAPEHDSSDSSESDAPGVRGVTPSGRIERRPSVIVQREAGVERIGPPVRPVTGEITPGHMTGIVPGPRASGGPPTLLIIAAAASIGAAITVTLYKQYYRRPAPAPAVAPTSAPAVMQVNLIFETEPPGAQVLRDGVEPIGVTPTVHEVAPQSPSRRYVFRLAGYEDSSADVAPGKQNERIRVIMRPLPVEPPKQEPPPTPPPEPANTAVPAPTPSKTGARPRSPRGETKPAPAAEQPEQKPPPEEEADLGELKNPFPKK